MEKTVKILLYDSVAGLGFAYGKGENEIPAERAAEFVRAGLGEYIGQKPSDVSEKAISQQAKKAEKR